MTHQIGPKRPRSETTQATTQAETTQGRNDSGPKRLGAETTRYRLGRDNPEPKIGTKRLVYRTNYKNDTSLQDGGPLTTDFKKKYILANNSRFCIKCFKVKGYSKMYRVLISFLDSVNGPTVISSTRDRMKRKVEDGFQEINNC